ncbi:hypothetical protein [Nocardiopsis quinghaiensis]|uniref:hypothetical protein n=1 Tax=Nocardiopsis quinghaiensis TaxID=464995 RepID=UPI001239FE8E|nr:hypothetical protein [Nocardiopsis quinghaiensis]
MKTEISPGDRPALVEELRSLAEEGRLAGRAVQLTALAEALDDGERLETWAEVDLGTAFPAAETIDPPTRGGAVRGIVEAAPTALVFLPILITWTGLAQAAEAYGRSQGDASLEGLSFLERWQGAFNGELPAWLAFDRVAVYTLTGILLLIAVVLAQALHRRWSDGRDEEERTQLARRLASAMTAAQFELGAVRLGSPARIASELGSSVQQLREVGSIAQRAQQDVRTTLEQVQENLRMAQSTITVLKEGSDGVTGAVHEGLDVVRDLYVRFGEVSEAIDRVATASEEFSRTAEGERVQLREELEQVVTGLAEQVDRTVSEGLEGLSGAVTESSGDIGRALASGEAQIRTALGEWQETGTGFAHRVELAADLSGRVAEVMRELPEAVERLHSGIDALHRGLEETGKRGSGLPEAVGRLREGVDALHELLAENAATGAAATKAGSEHGPETGSARAAGGADEDLVVT